MRAALALLALLAARVAVAVLPPQPALPPEWDARGERAAAPITRDQAAALARLEAEGEGGGKLTLVPGPQEGTLHHLFRAEGTLTPPSDAPPGEAALRFVARHRAVLGLGDADVRELDLRAIVRDPGTRAAHVVLAQEVDGIPVFGAAVRVHLDHEGRVVSASGDTARVVRPARAPAWGDPSQALARASGLVGTGDAAMPPVERVDEDGTVRFARGPFASAPWAIRAWFPMSDGTLRAAWVVTLDPPGATWPQLVIDAATGAPLSRVELVDHAATEGLVFREDPGRSPQVVVPFVDGEALTDPASPFGWSQAGETSGNNCHVADDRDGNDEDVEGRTAEGAGSPLSFSFPYTGTPADDLDASLTNLFWLNNWLHDRLARLGFDEASGNFQSVNASGEGRGGDAVRVDAQDGAGLNNANFGTPPDGFPPRMQMFLWNVTSPWRDSGFDGSVVAHELLHGVSNRLVGLAANHAGCLGGPQGGAMGEAWSDFYACSFWGSPVVGGWIVNDPLRGIRRAPYDAYPFHYGELCNQGAFEVHRDGEIWAATLWDLRRKLMERHGAWEGRCRAERLVLDGMKLAPCSPTFVDMRDAILMAARLRGDDGDACLLWEAFAGRGLGTGAVSRRDCTTLADASFDVPPGCAACGSLAPPSSLTLDTSRPNEVVARFTPSPDAEEHVLLRAEGGCPGSCSEASFVEVARGGPAITSLTAADVAGDLTAGGRFAFRVVALRGDCTAGTACAEAVVEGRCTLPPVAAAAGEALGVTALTREPQASCAVRVHWAPARSRCGLPDAIRHAIYRSQDPAFVPGPEHLVAVVAAPATSWLDRAVPAGEVTYVVRAQDLTAGGRGPLGGNEEPNDVRLTSSALGEPVGTATATHDGESGEAPGFRRTQTLPVNDWALVSDTNTRGGSAWHAASVEGGNAEKSLHLPPLWLGAAPRLRFVHAFDFEDGFDGGVLEISLDGGRTWRDLIDDIVAGGYETSAGLGRTVSASELIHEPNTDRLWTGRNASGFPSYDAVEVDLSPYAFAEDAQVRFRLIVDPLVANPGGWYVDDVVVEDVLAFGACVAGCSDPPAALLRDALACVPGAESTFAILDASGSSAGGAPLASDLPMVLTHDGPGSFAGRRWAAGPVAILELPPGTPEGDLAVTLTVRDERGCSSQAQATVAVRAETFVPSPVGASLRVTRDGPGVRLTWGPTDAASYNVLEAPIGAAGTAPGWELVGRVGAPESVLRPSGSRSFIVHSASDCGRSVP